MFVRGGRRVESRVTLRADCLCRRPAVASPQHRRRRGNASPRGNPMPKHSVLIVGAGIAGMRAALAASERGSDVALISKVHPLRTHGGTSQGGINAALHAEDRADLHAMDTVKGGDYLGDQDRSEEHTSELQSLAYLVCRLLLEKKKKIIQK